MKPVISWQTYLGLFLWLLSMSAKAPNATNTSTATTLAPSTSPPLPSNSSSNMVNGTSTMAPSGNNMTMNETVSSAPTASPNECTSIQPGDIQIILLNSQDPDQIVWYCLNVIPAGVDYIYATDDAWNGTDFVDLEGTIKIKVPEVTTDSKGNSCSGWCPGEVFSYGFPADQGMWTHVNTLPFALSTQGDTVLTYCLDGNGKPHFIHGFSYAPGGWAQPGLDNYTVLQQSALPETLKTAGSVQLPYYQNWIYIGTAVEPVEVLITEYYNNPSNYSGSDTVRNNYPGLNNPPSSDGSISSRFSGWMLLLSLPMALSMWSSLSC